MLFKITSPVLEKDIEEIGLSQRTLNCLRRCNCNTVEDVLDMQYKLPEIKGVGKKIISEAKNKILEMAIINATANM